MNAEALLPRIDVAQRFEEAVRAGRPEWLWMEVPEARWAAAAATIEIVLRDMLAHGHSRGRLLDDPVALSVACYTSGTGPLLGGWGERGKLTTTEANAAVLRLHLEHNRARMAGLSVRTSEAVDALSAAGAAPVVLKGMHTAHQYFDEPGARVSSDIDILLRPDELPIAAAVLTELGYVPGASAHRQRSWSRPDSADQPIALTYVHREDPWSIDLHERVSRKLAGGTLVADMDALVSSAGLDPWRVSAKGKVFPPPLLLAHLLMHASCSLESLTLQRQYEIGLVIQKSGGRDAFDWPAFITLCDRTDLWRFLYPALHCVARLSAGLLPDAILRRARDAALPAVRNYIESHSCASAHRVGRWSWTERYMWADGMLPLVRQFLDEFQPLGHQSLRAVMGMWRRRLYRQLGRLARQSPSMRRDRADAPEQA